MLYRLIYASTISRTAASRLASTVEDILLVSVSNNRRDGITGLLTCDGGHFVQVLEGSREAVQACYARIALDPRHHGLIVRTRGRIERRSFGRWSMCAVTLSSLDDALLQPPDIGFNVFSAEPGAVLQLLRSLASRHAAELDAAHTRMLSARGLDHNPLRSPRPGPRTPGSA